MPVLNPARHIFVASLVLCGVITAQPLLAQEANEEEGTATAPRIWTNETDLGLVAAEGNSRTRAFSFENLLQAKWDGSQFTFQLGGYRQTSQTITRFGFETESGLVAGQTSVKQLDQLRMYINAAYRRDLTGRFFFTAGGGWDRDARAGIERRLVGFAGVGNIWWDRDDLRFSTEYTFAYEYRTDEIPDPDLGSDRPSIRLAWIYSNNLFGKDTTVLTSTMDFFVNLKHPSVYRFITVTALTLGMSNLLSLRTSIEFRYEKAPGLETGALWDSDPRTNPDAVVIGGVIVRRQNLDTLLRLSLVLDL